MFPTPRNGKCLRWYLSQLSDGDPLKKHNYHESIKILFKFKNISSTLEMTLGVLVLRLFIYSTAISIY